MYTSIYTNEHDENAVVSDVEVETHTNTAHTHHINEEHCSYFYVVAPILKAFRVCTFFVRFVALHSILVLWMWTATIDRHGESEIL